MEHAKSIPMTPVTRSSNVAAYGYDADSNTLSVQFQGSNARPGPTYHYHNVPAHLHAKIKHAPSIGRFLNEHIIGKHRHSLA